MGKFVEFKFKKFVEFFDGFSGEIFRLIWDCLVDLMVKIYRLQNLQKITIFGKFEENFPKFENFHFKFS
jgi:hypothetical protein